MTRYSVSRHRSLSGQSRCTRLANRRCRKEGGDDDKPGRTQVEDPLNRAEAPRACATAGSHRDQGTEHYCPERATDPAESLADVIVSNGPGKIDRSEGHRNEGAHGQLTVTTAGGSTFATGGVNGEPADRPSRRRKDTAEDDHGLARSGQGGNADGGAGAG